LVEPDSWIHTSPLSILCRMTEDRAAAARRRGGHRHSTPPGLTHDTGTVDTISHGQQDRRKLTAKTAAFLTKLSDPAGCWLCPPSQGRTNGFSDSCQPVSPFVIVGGESGGPPRVYSSRPFHLLFAWLGRNSSTPALRTKPGYGHSVRCKFINRSDATQPAASWWACAGLISGS